MAVTVHEDIGLGETEYKIEVATREQGVQSRCFREQYRAHAYVQGHEQFQATYSKTVRRCDSS